MNYRITTGFPSLLTAFALAACMAVSGSGCAARNLTFSTPPNSPALSQAEADAALGQIHHLYQTGDLQAAYDSVQKLRRRNPYSWEIRITEGCIAADLGRKNEAIQAWQAVAALQPKSAKVQHETGMRLVQLGAASTGLRMLKSAVEHDPENTKYLLDLSAAYVSSGNAHTALAVLLQAHRRRPTVAEVPVAIARLYERQNNFSRAAHYYSVALKETPDDPTLLRQRGRMWYRLNEFEQAREDLAACEAALIAGGHWPALLDYGRACLKTGEIPTAHRIAATLGNTPTADTRDFQQFRVAVADTPMPAPAIAVPRQLLPVLLPVPDATSLAARSPSEIQPATAIPPAKTRPTSAIVQVSGVRETKPSARPLAQSGWHATTPKRDAPQQVRSTHYVTTVQASPQSPQGWKPHVRRQGS